MNTSEMLFMRSKLIYHDNFENYRPRTIKEFVNYFNYNQIDSLFDLSNNGNFLFHWSDWNISVKYFQKKYNSKNGFNLFNQFDSIFLNLKETKIWIKEKESKQIDLYDLYELIINNPSSELENKKISFVNFNGPYLNLKKEVISSKNMVSMFIYKNILSNKIPVRNFRLRVKGYLTFFLNNQNIITNVEQISKDGILLSTESEKLFNSILNSDELFINLSAKNFSNLINLSIEQYFYEIAENKIPYYFTLDKKERHQIDKRKVFDYNSDFLNKNLYFDKRYFFLPFSCIENKYNTINTLCDFMDFSERLFKKVFFKYYKTF